RSHRYHFRRRLGLWRRQLRQGGASATVWPIRTSGFSTSSLLAAPASPRCCARSQTMYWRTCRGSMRCSRSDSPATRPCETQIEVGLFLDARESLRRGTELFATVPGFPHFRLVGRKGYLATALGFCATRGNASHPSDPGSRGTGGDSAGSPAGG